MNDFKISFLKGVSFEQFKSFLDSLDEERKTWSLDLQYYNDEKDFYDGKLTQSILLLDNDKIIAFVDGYKVSDIVKINNIKPAGGGSFEISFVVKKEYQGLGIGTHMLIEMEKKLIKYNKEFKFIYAKHYKDNIASHKAFLKAGYTEAKLNNIDTDDNLSWKLKEIK